MRILSATVVAVALLAPPSMARQEGTSTLEKLSYETQALYGNVRTGFVRVYLPTPKWALNIMQQDFALRRWDLQLDKDVSERLRDDLGKENHEMRALIEPATQPTTRPAEARGLRLVPRGDGSFNVVGEQDEDRAVIEVGPRSIGVIIDDQGHVLLPYFLEKSDVGDQPLHVATGDGQFRTARFVGSDAKTGLTLLQMNSPAGVPRVLDGRRPRDGAMVLFLASTGEYGRLQVWTGGQLDTGIVVGVDGSICGFLRQGQFLEAARCQPVVSQLIASGFVKRPVLGAFIREVLPGDPVRGENPALGTRPAVLVRKVIAGSAAEKAGIRDGDLILAIADVAVGDPPSFAAALTPLEGATPVTILRGEQTLTVSVVLTHRK